MLSQSVALGAGQTVKFIDLGNFLRVLSANSAITVRTFRNGQVVTESVGVYSGYAEQFGGDNQFDAVEVYSATAQTVQIVIRNGQIVYYDQAPTGNVSVLNTVNVIPLNNGAASQSRVSLTNVNQQILAANAGRKYLMIQNNDAGAVMRVKIDGNAATAAQGFRIPAGSTYVFENFNVTGAINCMMETATGAPGNVEFAEA